MSQPQRYTKGEGLSAAKLNSVVNASKRAAEASGAPGASIDTSHTLPQGLGGVGIMVTVKSRLISVVAKLEDHGYTVTDGSNEYEITWDQIIVPVQPDLVGPDHDPSRLPQGFVPAEIAGQGRALTEPWRAWGILYRGPSPAADGTNAAGIQLLGLSPHRAC